MDSAESALRGALLQLTSPPMLVAGVVLLIAGVVALIVARAAARAAHRGRGPALAATCWITRSRAPYAVAPILAALVTLAAAHVVVGSPRHYPPW